VLHDLGVLVSFSEEGGEGPRREGKGEHAEQHEHAAEDAFGRVERDDVSVADRCDGRHNEVERGRVQHVRVEGLQTLHFKPVYVVVVLLESADVDPDAAI